MVGGSTPVVLTNRCRRGRVPSCRSVRHGLSFHQTMLFRVCSTNSTKAVAFLHSDKFLAAGVGSVLRVYDCNVVACCESRQHQWQGCSVAHWEAQAETHPKKDEASLLLADVPPVSRLVDQALFSSSTHISGIATSSQHSLVAAFGLGRLVVYELRQRAAKREKPQGALQEKEDGQLGSAVEICTQSLGAQQRHQADLPQLGKETPHPPHFLSPVFNYKRDQWILDVRIISPSLLNEGSTGDGAAGGSGLVRVLILVGLADGTVELLSASRSSTHCLATWTCGDRSLLYSLAIDVPRDAWVGPRSNGRCYSEVQVLGGSPLPLDECTETDTNKNCSAVFTERRRQSGAFLTIASGTVYSSIVLWRIPLSPQCQTPHLPDSTDRCTSGEKAHACYSSTSTADSPIDSGESNAVDSCGQKHFSPSFSPRSGATVVNPTQILKGHRGVIFKVRFYLDGQLLCSSSDDRELRLWWAGGPMSHELPKEEACKRSESLLKTDNYRTSYKCVSVLRGHRSRVWDIALLDLFMSQKYSVSSSPLRNDEEKTVAAETSSEMAFSVAERRYLIVSAGEDSSCRIWSLRGECLYSLLGHAGRGVRAICATESRTSGSLPLLASGGEDGDVKLWSLIESPSLVKLLKPRFFCSQPNSSSLVSSTTLSGYGPVINREIAPGTLRDADSTKDNKEVIAGRDIALPSVTGHSDFALIWDCRDYGRSDDFIREVRLLSTHCALVATNFGYVYLLHMKEFNSSDKERHTAEYLKQKNPTGETLTEAASLVANRKKHGLALVCTALVHSPVVLTSLRVVDSLVTCGCADGTFFFFLLDREAAQNEGVWQAGSDDRKAKISDPPRWQCFQQARVGNLFQLSLPCSDLEHEYLQRRGAVGGLHAVARNSLATRSFWTEVDVYGLCGSQDQPDSPCGVKSGELPQQPVTPVTSLSEEREYKANDHCSAHGGSHSDMNMNQEAFPSKRCTSFVGQRSVVAATSHTGLVSMWYVAAEQGVGPSGQLDVLDHPESLDKTGRHGDYEGTTALPDVGVTSCHTKARRGDGEAGEPDTPFPQKKSGFFAQVIATLQLPPTAQRKGDSTRCFSCLPLMGVSTGVSPDTKGDCEEDTIAKGGLDWAVQALTIALLFGDEAGSLHVVQVLVPELLDNDKDHKVTTEIRDGKRGGPDCLSSSWDWSKAQSAVTQTLEAAHRGQKVWDLCVQGKVILSCGGDGTILLLVARSSLSDMPPSGPNPDRTPDKGQTESHALPFALTICAISSVRVPQLSFMYSLVPTEAASPWWMTELRPHKNEQEALWSETSDPLKHHWLCAFRMADFILFDFTTSMHLMRVRCGNSRRPLDFCRESSSCYTFTSATKNQVFIYAERRVSELVSSKNSPISSDSVISSEDGLRNVQASETAHPGQGRLAHGKRKQEEKSVEREDAVNRKGDFGAKVEKLYDSFLNDSVKSASFNPGFHGREVLAVTWLDDETLCTGGEDNAIKVIRISSLRRPQLSDRVSGKECYERGTRRLLGKENVELPCSSGKYEQGRYHLEVQQTAVHHAGAVRCVRLLSSIRCNGDVVPQALVSSGACDSMSLFLVNPSTEPEMLNGVACQGRLRLRHLQTVRFSERGMGQDVRLNGVDGFVMPEVQLVNGEANSSASNLSVHLWAASSSAEVFYVEGCIEQGIRAIQPDSASRASSLRKRASLELEAAALCIRVVVLNDVSASGAVGHEQMNNNSCRLKRVVILVGLTTGHIVVVGGDTTGCLYRIGTLYAHQCGTNDICIRTLPSSAALDSRSFEVDQEQPKHTYCVASCGDDQSVTVQFIELEEDPGLWSRVRSVCVLSAVQLQNAHSSSARTCRLEYPLLFTAGWDRWVQVWEIKWPLTGHLEEAGPMLACRTGDTTADDSQNLPFTALRRTQRACKLDSRTPAQQQRRSWGEYVAEVVLRRVDAVKTSVADVASLDVFRTASHINLCATGSSGGMECFILSPT